MPLEGTISIPVFNVSESFITTRSRTSTFILLILRLWCCDANDKEINPRKATGCENIHKKNIRITFREIFISVCCLLNVSITAKSLLSIMKYADVSHCFKKEGNLFHGNYKPVSVLTVITKFDEAVLKNKKLDHYRDLSNIVLFAFLKKYNYQSRLKVIEDIESALDKGNKQVLFIWIYVRLFIAYPSLLIAKLDAYGLFTACELREATSIRECNETKYQIVEVPVKYWIRFYSWSPSVQCFFINDAFLYMERCNLYDYVDDDSMINSFPKYRNDYTKLEAWLLEWDPVVHIKITEQVSTCGAV